MPASLGQLSNSSGSASTRRSSRPKASTNTPKASTTSSPNPVPQTDKCPWRSPDELPYIDEQSIPQGADVSQSILIDYLRRKAFSIPPRELSANVQLFPVTTADGSTVSLPRGYRVPLMFVAKFLWDSLKLVLTASDPQKEWDEYKFDIIHLSRLCHHLFAQAEDAKNAASAKGAKGIDRLWRSATFDRLLTRFYHRWFISRDRFLRLFWEEFDEDEYENDILKHDWVRWSIRGHKGFALTKEEIQDGITAQQFMQGLDRNVQGIWIWNINPVLESLATQLPTAESASPTNTVLAEPTSDAAIALATLDELFGARKIACTPSHNTLEVKKEHLELREKMSAEPTLTDLPLPLPSSSSLPDDTPRELIQPSTATQLTPVDVPDRPATSSILPLTSTHVEKPRDSAQQISTKVVPKRPRARHARKSTVGFWGDRFSVKNVERRYSPPSSEDSNTDEAGNDTRDKDYKAPRKKKAKLNHESSKVEHSTSTPRSKLRPTITLKVSRHKQAQTKAPKAVSGSSGEKQGRSQTFSTSNTIPRVITSENVQAGAPIFSFAAEAVARNLSDSATSGLRFPFGNASTPAASTSPNPDIHKPVSPTEPLVLTTPNLEPETASDDSPTPIQLETSSTTSDEKTSVPIPHSTSGERGDEEESTNTTLHNDVSQSDIIEPFHFGRSVSPPTVVELAALHFGRSTPPPSVRNGVELTTPPLPTSDMNEGNDSMDTTFLTPRPKSPASAEEGQEERVTNVPLVAPQVELGSDSMSATTRWPLPHGRSVSPSTHGSLALTLPISAVPLGLSGSPLGPSLPSRGLPHPPPSSLLSAAPSPSQFNPDQSSQSTQEINSAYPLSPSSDAEARIPSVALPIHSESSCPSMASTTLNAVNQGDMMNVDEPITGKVPDEEIQRYLMSVTNGNQLRRAILVLRGLLDQDKGSKTIPSDYRRDNFADGQEGLTTAEHLSLLARCSGLLSAYRTVYSGGDLDIKLRELDDRLYRELLKIDVDDLEISATTVQVESQSCKLVDEGVTTVEFLPIDREAPGPNFTLEIEHEGLRTSPPVIPVASGPLSPDATMVDLSSLQRPRLISPPPDVMKTEVPVFGSEATPTATRIMTSIMRNMADLLDCSSAGQDLKGKSRMVDGAGAARSTDGLPIVSVLLQEFKTMKEDMQKTLQANRAEMDSMARLHRTEVNALKDELRACEDRYRREAEIQRQQHRQEIGTLMETLREAQKEREKGEAEVESRSPMFELFDLRRRIMALEGHSQSLPLSPAHPGPSTRPLFEDESDVTVTRRITTHPLGHLFESDDGFVPLTPVLHRHSSDGIASVSKPGTPIQYDREGSSAIVIDDSIPLPIKSQRKFMSIHRFSMT